jgi:outer membrane protein assembly factor BamE
LSSIQKLISLAGCAAALLTGCQYVPMIPGITPYRIDIQQGNYVTQDMVAKLKPGMTKSQVRFALGTPLVVDVFHTDRWDYVYVLQKGGRVREHRRIIVLFEQDKLLRIEGDVAPSIRGAEADAAAAALVGAPAASSTDSAPAANAPSATAPSPTAPSPTASSPTAPATSRDERNVEPNAPNEPPAATTTPLQ